jgi:Xaa-Pro aminopeptidase
MKRILPRYQEALRAATIDAWMMYDFRGSNDLAWQMLDIAPHAHCTRRWAVVIPAQGTPVKIVHRMEQLPLEHIDIPVVLYDTRESWDDALRTALGSYKTVAMEYSPMNALPVTSKVDAGTIESIRALGHTVVSSADIAQQFTAVLSEEQLAGAAVTGGQLRDVITSAFELIRERLIGGAPVQEYEVQQFILQEFARLGLVTDSAPIVAIGPNAASPHYAPSVVESSAIETEMVVVIDAWCKRNVPGAAYADLTWVGYTGVAIPADVASTFTIIANARNAALALVAERYRGNLPVYGYEVDRACRAVVEQAGMASHFIHRTGHNITTEIHGPGANMDDYETHDTRRILPGTMFSIEPGIYIPDILGMRTEIDVVVQHDGTVAVPSSPLQTSILPLLADEWKQ